MQAYYYLLGNKGAGPFSMVGEGSSLNVASQQGAGGHVLIVPIKLLKNFLAHSVFIN